MNTMAVPSSCWGALDDLEDLGLDGHVEGGRRLVGDEHFGVVGHGHGNHGADACHPENSCGYCRALVVGCGMPTRSSGSIARVLACLSLTLVGLDHLGDLVPDPVDGFRPTAGPGR